MNNLKIALIGPGRMGILYAKSVINNKNAELIAICGNSKINTLKNTSDYNVPKYFNNSWKSMLDDFPEIDTIIISTSEWAHLEPFKYSIITNKNIILEKPIAINREEYIEMNNIYKNKQFLKKVFVCFTCRFDRIYMRAKKEIRKNRIGEISYIYSRRNTDLNTVLRVKGKFSLAYWIIVHDIDLMRWMFESEVREVFSLRIGNQEDEKGIITNLFFDNGKIGVIESVFFGPELPRSNSDRMDLHGERGKIELNISDSVYSVFKKNDIETLNVKDDNKNIDNMINHFIEVIQLEKKPIVSFEDGFKSVLVSEAIQESLDRGCKVKI